MPATAHGGRPVVRPSREHSASHYTDWQVKDADNGTILRQGRLEPPFDCARGTITARQIAFHLEESLYYAHAVGNMHSWPTRLRRVDSSRPACPSRAQAAS